MLRSSPRHGQALTDVVHGQGCRVHHADNAVGQLKHALRMKIITDNLLNELVHVPGRQFRRCQAPQGPRFFKLFPVEIDSLPSPTLDEAAPHKFTRRSVSVAQ